MKRLAVLAILLTCVACRPRAAEPGFMAVDLGGALLYQTDPDHVLTAVGSVIEDGAGNVIVTQPADKALLIFNASGSLKNRIGRAGDGPGEFRSLGALTLLGDTVIVPDAAARRLTLYVGDSLVTRRVNVPELGFPLLTGLFYAIGPSRVLHLPSVVPDLARGTIVRPLLRGDLDAQVLDTVTMLPTSNWILSFSVRGITHNSFQPFGDETLWSLSPDGRLIALLDRHDETGAGTTELFLIDVASRDTVLRRSFQLPTRPVTNQMRDSAIEAIMRDGRLPNDARGPLVNGLYVPGALASVTGLRLAQDSTVVLRGIAEARDSAWWYLLPFNGRQGRKFRLPASARVMQVRGDRVWVVVLDEFDVPTIWCYQLRRTES